MATMERMFSFRHEGHMFFIYDHRKKKEEDDPKDAILYFYPRSVNTDDQIALVGGLIGTVDFCLEFLPQEMPQIIKISTHNFALLQHGEYIIGLAATTDIPSSFLLSHMQFLWSTFVLYQGSIVAFRQRQSEELFVEELNLVWDMYLPLCQSQGDVLGQTFQVIPYIQLHESQACLYLHASHILQRSLGHTGVLAGAVFSKHKVLCTQLSNSLTRKLLLLMMQTEFPSVEVNSNLELPGGVSLISVYLTQEDHHGINHRRKKKYKSSPQPSFEADMRDGSRSGEGNKLAGHSNHSDSAIGTGSDQGNSCAAGVRNEGQNPSLAGSARSSFGASNSTDKSDSSRRVASMTESDIYVDTVSEFHNIADKSNSSNGEISEISKTELEVAIADSSFSSHSIRSDSQENCDKENSRLFSLKNEDFKVDCDGSHQPLINDTGEQIKSPSHETGADLVSHSKGRMSSHSDLHLSMDCLHQKDSSVNENNESSHCINSNELVDQLSEKENSLSESQSHSASIEKETNNNLKTNNNTKFETVNSKKDRTDNSVAIENESSSCVDKWDLIDNRQTNSVINIENTIAKNKEGKDGKEKLVCSPHDPEGQCKMEDLSCNENYVRSFEDSFRLQTNSGDESPFDSSSCEVKLDGPVGFESSLLSLYNSDVASGKDRLTFDNLDSENSDCGIMSPDAEVHRFSPLAEKSEVSLGVVPSSAQDKEENLAPHLFSANNSESWKSPTAAAAVDDSKPDRKSSSDWVPQDEGLEELNLYMQGHSDTLLVLLIKKDVKCTKSYIHSLWKSCLSHLAELDFEVKNVERHAKDESENICSSYQYMKYDSYPNKLCGSALLPVTSLASEMVDSTVRMHKDFTVMPDLMDATYRSHTACSFARRSLNNETFFQIGLTTRGGINPGERTFHLEQTAERCLVQDHGMNLL